MQVEHIDANTIRVRINKSELAKRGLKVLDLLGDKNKIQQFFYSILEEVDTDHSFSEDNPVTFQVMPNDGGLDLLISKVNRENKNDELSSFLDDVNQPLDDDPRHSFLDLDADDDLDEIFDDEKDAEYYENYVNQELKDLNRRKAEQRNASQPKVSKNFWKFQKKQAYSFKDFGVLGELANSLQVSDLDSALYYEHDRFYLELSFNDENYAELKPADAWAIANEYGVQVKSEEMARVRTVGKCLIETAALEQLRGCFAH
ncbi:adaptor protein MecA [Lactobacillus sp. ESL0681]|uniref:adaptor protein MecA n=1 Tax=Lactobacillus sp. ESL0681 TaxID=2983211 RepID=UPI0023F9EF38|nr:adaptor protein MecA [Lactobacillus sp. ESL0681]WEV40408.1 adaptor protein MecA [Lactobacillus sp. ESL0681]